MTWVNTRLNLMSGCMMAPNQSITPPPVQKSLSNAGEKTPSASWRQEISLPETLRAPPLSRCPPSLFSYAFFTRILYFCLADANYLAIEAFYSNLENKAVERGDYPDLNALQQNFNQFINAFRRCIAQAPQQTEAEKRNAVLNRLCSEIPDHCRQSSRTTVRAVYAHRPYRQRQNLHFHGVRAGTR